MEENMQQIIKINNNDILLKLSQFLEKIKEENIVLEISENKFSINISTKYGNIETYKKHLKSKKMTNPNSDFWHFFGSAKAINEDGENYKEYLDEKYD